MGEIEQLKLRLDNLQAMVSLLFGIMLLDHGYSLLGYAVLLFTLLQYASNGFRLGRMLGRTIKERVGDDVHNGSISTAKEG